MKESNEPTRSPKGRWFSRRKLSRKDQKRLRHLISSEKIHKDGETPVLVAFCGNHLVDPVAADSLGPWDPEEHLDVVCPECLKWWRDLKPNPAKVDEPSRENREEAKV